MLPDKKINALWQRLNEATPPTTSWSVEAQLIKPNGNVLPITDVTYVTTVADYAGSVGPQIVIETKMGVVFYKTHVLAERDDLKIRLTYRPQSHQGSKDPTVKPLIRTFDALLIDTIDTDMLGMGRDNELATQEASNLLNIRFNLIHPALNEMRLFEVGGIYNGCDVKTLLMSLLSYGLDESSQESTLRDVDYQGVRGVGIVNTTNTKVYDHIVIPVGTRLTKLATYIQSHYGVYGAGIGCYFQQGYWYVYPLYANGRFDQTKKRMTLVVLNPEEVPGNDKTFMVEKDHYTVFVSGSVDIQDNSEKTLLNTGSGIRFQRASDLEQGLFKVSKNKAVGLKDEANKNMALEKRRKGLQNLRYAKDRFTDNPYLEYSNIAEGKGQLISVEWDLSNPQLLYPAMPIKVLYRKNNRTQFVYGTLTGYRSRLVSSGNLADNDYRYRTRMVIFVDKTPSLLES